MKLNITKPALVIVGAWNRSIFQPGWVARNLFDYPEGADVQIEKLISVGGVNNQIDFIDSVGVMPLKERINLYVKDFERDTLSRCEHVVLNLMTVLNHTPTTAFGVNVSFIEEDASAEIVDLLQPADKLDERFKVLHSSLNSSIELEDGVVLNFVRTIDEDGTAIFDLNFHHKESKLLKNREFCEGLIGKYYEQSKQILNDNYGLNELEGISGFDVIGLEGGDE